MIHHTFNPRVLKNLIRQLDGYVYENVISGLKPGRRNIVLMHDSASKMHTLEALESIIDYGLENGYEFKVITAETEPMTHPIAN